ncbi:MAG TPA: efflux transporter outer membrane subunit [Syntrophorhabdaceae bacterium]|jgi:multidrug efflux system outer membrane protein
MIRTIAAFILSLLLVGCATMAPDYMRPVPPVPGEWPEGAAYKATGAEQNGAVPLGLQWRAFYMDDKLRELMRIALDNNRDLRVASLNIERARGFYRIQFAALFPTLNAYASETAQRLPADLSYLGRPVVSRQFSYTVGFSSYELDFFGRVRSLKDQALEQYLATEQARRSVQISLLAEIAYAYLNRAADYERLKVSLDTLESQQASYKLVENKYRVGSASELDLRQAQTRVDAARVDIAYYTAQVAQDENGLALLLGSPVPSRLLVDELGTDKMFEDIIAGVSSEVLLRRPDIEQAEHQLKAANANIGAARAAFFPTVTLTTGAGTISGQLSGLFTSGQGTWIFAPQITLPIFDFGSRWANLAVSKADRDIAVARYERSIQTAFKEVADALAVRGTVGDQLAAQESLVQASAEAYRLSELRYAKGIDNYLGVLDSQRSLYVARLRLVSIRLAQLVNLVNLYKVLGGGEGE